MRHSPSMTITLQSDQGFTVGECFGARGRVLTGRTPQTLLRGEEWVFRMELSYGMGTVVGRLRVVTSGRAEWRAALVAIQRADRATWDRWLARAGEGEPAAPPARKIPASAITMESLALARRSGSGRQ